MIQCRDGLGFASEALARFRIVTDFFRQKLQSYRAAQIQVFGAIDQAHTASADDVQHAVMGDDFAGQLADFQPGFGNGAGARPRRGTIVGG
jgi:hypothetical protein